MCVCVYIILYDVIILCVCIINVVDQLIIVLTKQVLQRILNYVSEAYILSLSLQIKHCSSLPLITPVPLPARHVYIHCNTILNACYFYPIKSLFQLFESTFLVKECVCCMG